MFRSTSPDQKASDHSTRPLARRGVHAHLLSLLLIVPVRLTRGQPLRMASQFVTHDVESNRRHNSTARSKHLVMQIHTRRLCGQIRQRRPSIATLTYNFGTSFMQRSCQLLPLLQRSEISNPKKDRERKMPRFIGISRKEYYFIQT